MLQTLAIIFTTRVPQLKLLQLKSLRKKAILCLCFTIAPTFSIHAEQVTAAIAANFAGTIKQLKPLFEQQSGHRLVTWLSSARVVRCWVKSRNERNPRH